MRISDWSSDVCSSDLLLAYEQIHIFGFVRRFFAGLLGFDGNCGKETRRHQRLPQVIHFSAVIQLTAFEPGQNVDMLRCEDEIARRRKPAEAGTRSCVNGQCVIACRRLRIERSEEHTSLRERKAK